MSVFDFIRFKKRPPEKKPPPKNELDIFYDADLAEMVSQDDQNVKRGLGVTSAAWGSITGTLSDQTDLQAALDAKAAASHTHVSADITDASTGGNGASDDGKVAKFGVEGQLVGSCTGTTTNATGVYGTASGNFAVGVSGYSSNTSNGYGVRGVASYGPGSIGVYGSAAVGGLAAVQGNAPGGGTIALHGSSSDTSAVLLKLEDSTNGTLLQIDSDKATTVESETAENLLNALGIPTYADETAANAAEAVNVVYWNTATGKVQVTTA